jgi:hypothetical protein
VGLQSPFTLIELTVTRAAGEPDVVSCALAYADTVLLPPNQMLPEESNTGLQAAPLLLGMITTTGSGEPDLANWAFVNSNIGPDPGSATHRSPEASKASPLGVSKPAEERVTGGGRRSTGKLGFAVLGHCADAALVGHPQVTGGVKGETSGAVYPSGDPDFWAGVAGRARGVEGDRARAGPTPHWPPLTTYIVPGTRRAALGALEAVAAVAGEALKPVLATRPATRAAPPTIPGRRDRRGVGASTRREGTWTVEGATG